MGKERFNKNNGIEKSKEKTVTKTNGFIGIGQDSNLLQVDIRDGKMIRIRPFHYETTAEIKPWKIKARGQVFEVPMKSLVSPLSLAYKNRVYSPNRIQYPLKRVDWDPTGERNPQNRGKSGYTRISWDEASQIVADEIKRVQNKYGPTAVLSQSDGHGETKTVHNAHGCSKALLELMGGCTVQHRNTDSWEGWYWGAKHVWGCEPVGQMQTQSNLFPDIAQNTELLLFWGCDPETTTWGFSGQLASKLCYWFSDLKIQSIYICPDLNYGAAVHNDKWIPIRPNTDAALQLAIAYIWITEGTYDKEYIATHSVGFDKFQEYVIGNEDGQPKTAEWAADITGVPSYTIKALARLWASKRTSIAHGNGGCYIRGPYATEPGRLEVILLGMQGLGKPGCHQVKMIEWGIFGGKAGNLDNPPLPRSTVYPNVMGATLGWNPKAVGKLIENYQFIPKDLIHDALNNDSISWYGMTLARTKVEDQFTKYTYPVKGGSEIHMIWTDTPCWITCWNDSNSYIKGLRSPKVECIVAQHPWLENDCGFADIILPSNTKFETDDISTDTLSGNFAVLVHDQKCVEPVGESKSDFEVVCMVADKLGLLFEYTNNLTVEDWIRYGYETSGVQDKITWDEFMEKGYYIVPTDPDWEKYPAGMHEFYKEPEKNPLTTPTGKLEIYSERLERNFPGDKERPPIPHWIERGETHDERLSGERAKKYPLLVISNHGRWRVHANHDDMIWLREIETCKIKGPDGYLYQPVWMNPSDAAKRGIKHGDIVKIYNERGAVLAGAYITERMMADSISIDHGARYDALVPGELDRGGAINTISPHKLTSKNATGMAVGGFLAEVERVSIDELRQKYPEAFTQPYDPAAGLCFERALIRSC